MSATELKPLRWMSSRVSTCTGTAVSISALRMREPVTWTVSRVRASCAVDGASCAAAAGAISINRDSWTPAVNRWRGGMAVMQALRAGKGDRRRPRVAGSSLVTNP